VIHNACAGEIDFSAGLPPGNSAEAQFTVVFLILPRARRVVRDAPRCVERLVAGSHTPWWPTVFRVQYPVLDDRRRMAVWLDMACSEYRIGTTKIRRALGRA
jgi:hypothetical protein